MPAEPRDAQLGRRRAGRRHRRPAAVRGRLRHAPIVARVTADTRAAATPTRQRTWTTSPADTARLDVALRRRRGGRPGRCAGRGRAGASPSGRDTDDVAAERRAQRLDLAEDAGGRGIAAGAVERGRAARRARRGSRRAGDPRRPRARPPRTRSPCRPAGRRAVMRVFTPAPMTTASGSPGHDLGEDAAELAAVEEHVVRPLQARGVPGAAQLLDAPRASWRRPAMSGIHPRAAGGMPAHAHEHRDRERRARRRGPRAVEAPAPRALVGREQRARGAATRRATRRRAATTSALVESVDLDDLDARADRGGEGISLASGYRHALTTLRRGCAPGPRRDSGCREPLCEPSNRRGEPRR